MSTTDNGLRSGLKWNSIAQLLNQVSVFITGFILMRLLTPEDFGLVAIVTVFLGFSQLFTNVGLSSSIINQKNVSKYDYDNIFTFSLMIGSIMALLMYIFSNPLASFFDDHRLAILFQIASIALFISPLGAIPAAILKRKLLFKALAIINIISTFVSLGVAIVMAYYDYGYYSLIAQKLIYLTLNIVLVFIVSKYIPYLWFSFKNLKGHLNFGIPILGSKIINYSIGNLDNFLIGKFLGTSSLGYYGRAFSIVTIPSTRIGLIINSTMFPVFSNMKNRNVDIKNSVLKLFELILYVLFLLALLYVISSRSLIQIISPDGEWDSIIPIIQALAFVSVFKPIINFYSSILASLGLTKLSFKTELIGGLIIGIGFMVGVNFSLLNFSFIYCISSFLFFVSYSIIFSKILKLNRLDLFNLFKYKFLVFIIVTVVSFVFLNVNFNNPFLELPIGILLVIILWFTLNYIFERNTSKFILKTIKSFI